MTATVKINFYLASAFVVLIAVLAVACSQSQLRPASFFTGESAVENIQTRVLHEMLAEREARVGNANEGGEQEPSSDFVVVDVRSEKEFDVSVIPGAITKPQFEKDAASYRDKLVICYCTVGWRSGIYAKQMADKGFEVKNYKGSILAWVNAGLPLVTLDGQPTNRVHTYSDRYQIPATYEKVTQ